MEFDPIKAEAEARKQNPAYDAARIRQEAEKQKYLAPVIEYFAKLEEEIATMPIAQRFRRDRKPELGSGVGTCYSPQVADLNEADFKRTQLLSDLQRTRSEAMNLIGSVEAIVMDMEATKLD